MKAKLSLLASLFFAAGFAVGAPEHMDPGQLPPAVKKTLDASAGGKPVKAITVVEINGKRVYNVELERKYAPNPMLRITEDGRMLRDTTAVDTMAVPPIYPESGGLVVTTIPKLTLAETPGAVQQTAEKVAAGRDIAGLERTQWNRRPAYRVSLRENGRNPAFYIAEDGSLLAPPEKLPGITSLFMGTRFEDTPVAVQQAILRAVGEHGEIVKIEREGGRGEPSARYQVDLQDAHGAYRVRVAEDGRILENTRHSERPANSG